ncbi:hypothetical protein [Stenotrophomonas rhizophila]|uniref:hypothetical protein n=1 Tax=Stenotrophomonas rhizophila TaxID=216778 RepID=UPI0011A88F85|nr:hypothetical protein [Stenotrophomonas rhizophila]
MRMFLLLAGFPLLLVPLPVHGQGTPRPLSAQEMQALRDGISAKRASVDEEARAAVARRQARLQAHKEDEDEDEYYDEGVLPAAPTPGFADILAHGVGVFRDEMAKKDAEQAAMQANLDRIRKHAEAADREREQRAREAQALAARQRSATQLTVAVPGVVTQARNLQLQADVAAERERLAAAKVKAQTVAQANDKAVAPGRPPTTPQHQASRNAAAEAGRGTEAARLQALRQSEQSLRSSFGGHATTCIGGGKDVLYLQSSRPAKLGCNVSFEARCPGVPMGAGVRFSQANYIGSSCMGIGDSIRIGAMGCPAPQVSISMTGADCGSGG